MTTLSRFTSALTLGLVTCFALPASAGIYIGNPIVLESLTTDSSTLETANGIIDSVTFEVCNRGTKVVLTVDDEIDLVNGLVLDLLPAEYCKVEVKYSSDVDFEGDAGSGWSQTLTDDSFVLVPNAAEDAFVLELTEISAADVILRAIEE